MSWMAAAIVGGSLISGYSSSRAAKKAAGAQSDATEASLQAQRESDARFYAEQERIRQALSPYVQAGYEAIGYTPQQSRQMVDDLSAPVQPPVQQQQYQPVNIPSTDTGLGGGGTATKLNEMGQPEYTGTVNIDPQGERPSVYNYQFNSPAELLAAQQAWDRQTNNPMVQQNGIQRPMEFAPTTTTGRQKPSFEGTIQNAQGTVIGADPTYSAPTGMTPGGTGLRAFGQDRGLALPSQTASIQSGDRTRRGIEGLAGSGDVRGMQQFARAGQEGLSQLGKYSTAGGEGLSGLGTYSAAGQEGLSGLGTYSAAGQGAVPILQQYAQSGAPALEMQQALAGTLGPEAQQAAYAQVEASPEVQYMMDKAKEGILSGGSATGNLRAGRTTAALAEMNPAILSQAIRDKYSQLGQLSSMGGQYAGNLANMGAGIDQYQTGLGAGIDQYRTGVGVGVDQYQTGLGADASRYLTSEAAGAGRFLTGAGNTAAQNLYGGSQAATTNLAQFGLSAAGRQPGNAPVSPNVAIHQNQGAIGAGAALAQGNALANAVNSGMQNYFTYKQLKT